MTDLYPLSFQSTQCRDDDILFLKLLFVTNRDSIAKTLGKRLAQKKMAKDLTTWLNACRSRNDEDEVHYEGLEEIAAHIDPTDFIAFNNYQRNLRIFSNFALNTDSDANPWVVVNTGDRYAARQSLMNAFRSQLHRFKAQAGGRTVPPTHTQGLSIVEMMKKKVNPSRRHVVLAWITAMCLLLLAYIYAENTKWDDSWFRMPTSYNISSLLEGDMDDDSTLGPVIDINEKKGKTSKKKGTEVIVDEDPVNDKKTKAAKEEKEIGEEGEEEEGDEEEVVDTAE